MIFESDQEALKFLAKEGIHEVKNGVLRVPSAAWPFDRVRDAVGYLCNEWDFTYEIVY